MVTGLVLITSDSGQDKSSQGDVIMSRERSRAFKRVKGASAIGRRRESERPGSPARFRDGVVRQQQRQQGWILRGHNSGDGLDSHACSKLAAYFGSRRSPSSNIQLGSRICKRAL